MSNTRKLFESFNKYMNESYSEKLGGEPEDFVKDIQVIRQALENIDVSKFGSHLAVQMVEDWLSTCDYQIERGNRLASRNEFYTESEEIDARPWSTALITHCENYGVDLVWEENLRSLVNFLRDDEVGRYCKEEFQVSTPQQINDPDYFDMTESAGEELDKDKDTYLKRMNKQFKNFCNSLEIDPRDLDDALFALDELEGEFGDNTGEYEELREFIHNELLNESCSNKAKRRKVRKESEEYIGMDFDDMLKAIYDSYKQDGMEKEFFMDLTNCIDNIEYVEEWYRDTFEDLDESCSNKAKRRKVRKEK